MNADIIHRYYDPNAGRYLTPDPMGLNGGDPTLYSYAAGNPLRFIDAMGLSRADTTRISQVFQEWMTMATDAGYRTDPPNWNNLFSLGGLCGLNEIEACGGQSNMLKIFLDSRLPSGTPILDDNWDFPLGHQLLLPHWWVEGHSSDECDPILVMDPQQHSFSMKTRQ